MTQATLMMPRKMNEPRHVTATINRATRGGVKALPSRTLAWVISWANARFSFGVQSLIACVDTGNVAPSPNPSMTRKKSTAASVDCTCQQGGGRPDNAADDQPNSRAEPVDHSTTDNLEDELWIGKSGVHKPDLRVGQKFVLRILEVPRRPRIWRRLSPCRLANRILHFLCWPFFQRIIEVSIGTKSAVLPFRRQNAEAVVTKRSKPRPFRFPVSRGTVWRESPPLPRTWPRTIATTPESPGY